MTYFLLLIGFILVNLFIRVELYMRRSGIESRSIPLLLISTATNISFLALLVFGIFYINWWACLLFAVFTAAMCGPLVQGRLAMNLYKARGYLGTLAVSITIVLGVICVQ